MMPRDKVPNPPKLPILDVTSNTKNIPPTLQHWSTPLSCNLYISKVGQTPNTISFLVKLIPKSDVPGSCIDSFMVEFSICDALKYIKEGAFIARIEHIYLGIQEQGSIRAAALSDAVPEWGLQ